MSFILQELRAFQFQNNLSRLSPPDTTADTVLHMSAADTETANRLPALSNETIVSLLSDPEVLTTGMGVSELATVAIVTRLSGKHSIFVVKQVGSAPLLLPLSLFCNSFHLFYHSFVTPVSIVGVQDVVRHAEGLELADQGWSCGVSDHHAPQDR